MEEANSDCMAQWNSLWDQCNGYEDSDVEYWWSEDCDMIELFEEAWGIWYGDEMLVANLKRVHEKMQPRIKVAKAAHAKLAIKSAHKKHVQTLVKHGAKIMQGLYVEAPGDECFNVWPVSDDCVD